jgi:hypothetical protein
MLSKGFTEDRPGALTEASDVSVRDGGALFESIERVACEYRFSGSIESTEGAGFTVK